MGTDGFVVEPSAAECVSVDVVSAISFVDEVFAVLAESLYIRSGGFPIVHILLNFTSLLFLDYGKMVECPEPIGSNSNSSFQEPAGEVGT